MRDIESEHPDPQPGAGQPRASERVSRSLDAAPASSRDGERNLGDAPKPRPGSPRRRARVLWSLLAILVLAAGGGWWVLYGKGRGNPPAAAQGGPPRVPVQAATAGTNDVPIYLDGLGTVQAFNLVTVRSRVDGELVEVAFTEGQMVTAGDLIARIDSRPYQAALDQAEAKKKQDEAMLASTRLDLARTSELATRSFASQQQLDQQTANVASQSAQISSDTAAIDNARTQLGFATIRAPLTGRTGLRLVDRGNVIRTTDQTGIVEIAQLQPISVVFTAPENMLREVATSKQDGDVQVIALAPDGATPLGTGTLALINNSVDAASGTVKLKAAFPNAEDRLWPGLSVNTKLLLRTLRGVLTVPAEALQRGPDQLFAFVVGPDDKVEKRVLKVGAITEGRAVILDGLREGDLVVTAGQSRLQTGALVAVAAPSHSERQAADASPAAVR